MIKPEIVVPEGFDAFVSAQIQPLFAAMQKEKAAGKALMKKYGPLGFLAGTGLASFSQFVMHWPIFVTIAGFMLCILIGLLPGGSVIHSATSSFGEAHIDKMTKFLGLSHQERGFEPPNFEKFINLKLVPKGDRQNYSHLISGTHDGIDFTIYEAKIEERRTRVRGKRTETYWATIFHGQLLHSPFDYKFFGTTVIARDRGWFNTKGRFGKTMKPMGLADPKFEKLFEVYTTDQVEGRVLVDPAFMVRLLELEDHHKERRAMSAFHENCVFVALHGGIKFFGAPDDKSTAAGLARETLESFSHIFHFLDMLKGKTGPK